MRLSLPRRRPLRIATLVALVLAFVIVATGVIALFVPSPAAASSTSLEVLDGIVAVSHAGAQFGEGRDGDLLQQGDVIRTGDESHAILTFYDGSTIEVEPNSEIIVQTLQATASGDIVMTLQQNFGRTWHVVSRALTPNSKYEVRTPTSTATVRGTAFIVTVEASGRTSYQTTDGTVAAAASGQVVPVPAGFVTSVAPGAAPDPSTPAPQPDSVVRIVVDATPNAVVVDPNGRAVGVLNGLPVRYVPGSTVQLIDGKLVITIPNPALGRLDTHVQPPNAAGTSIDVNIQVIVGGATVGNVIDSRAIDSNGVAKGGVVLTTAGTYLIPDEDAKNSRDPRIGRIPPPPPGGLRVPFVDPGTPAPTAIVTAAPSFVPRFNFDPRATVAATATPAPPSPSAISAFRGAYQPYVAPTATTTATPEPNKNLILFTSTSTAPPELTKLTLATPTPAPTLDVRLLSPLLLVTPTPTPAPTFLILRSFDAAIPIASLLPAPTPTPTPQILLRSPIIIVPPTSSPALATAPPLLVTPLPIILTPPPATAPPVIVTRAPIASLIILPPPTVVPTPEPTIAPIVPTFRIVLPTATLPPTSVPTVPPIVTIVPRTIAPIITPAPTAPPVLTIAPRTFIPIVTIAPTPAPTLAPLPTRSINCRIVVC